MSHFIRFFMLLSLIFALSGSRLAMAQEDVTAPVILGLDFFPQVIDTTVGDQAVTVLLEFQDDLSGIDLSQPGAPCNFFGAGNIACGNWRLVSGNMLGGVLQSDVLFPAFSPLGDYRLLNIMIRDRVLNRTRLDDPSTVGFDNLLVNSSGTAADDADNDGIPDIADNCPYNANPNQEDADLDLIGDVCDPFPNTRDNEQAQCEADLVQVIADLDQCLAQSAFSDEDSDGEHGSTDQCPGTPNGAAVNTAGCSQSQFCAAIDASTKEGRITCKRSDWRNDEPRLRDPEDCTVQLCIAVNQTCMFG